MSHLDFSQYPKVGLTNGSAERALWLSRGIFEGISDDPADEEEVWTLRHEISRLTEVEQAKLRLIYAMNQQCHAVALAIHQRTGWTMAAVQWDENERTPDHIFVVTPQGLGLDALGTFTLGRDSAQPHAIESYQYHKQWKTITAEDIAFYSTKGKSWEDYYAQPNMTFADSMADQILDGLPAAQTSIVA